jgi:hypothetical protein
MFPVHRPTYQFHNQGYRRPGLEHRNTLEVQTPRDTTHTSLAGGSSAHNRFLQKSHRGALDPVPPHKNSIPLSESHPLKRDPTAEIG